MTAISFLGNIIHVAVDFLIGNHEPPTSILTNVLQDYLETTDGQRG